MAWFRIDDQSTFHRKVVAAGNEAFGAWARMGAWCSNHQTNGSIGVDVAFLIAGSKKVVERLLTVGLLEVGAINEYQIHDFLDWNPSAEELVKIRSERSSAGRRGAEKTNSKKAANRPANAAATESANAATNAAASVAAEARQTDRQKVAPFPFPFPDPEKRDLPLTPSWFRDAWLKRAGIRMIADGALFEPWRLTVEFARAADVTEEVAATALFDGFDEVQSTWDGKTKWATYLFVKHFEAIQPHAVKRLGVNGDDFAKHLLRARGDS